MKKQLIAIFFIVGAGTLLYSCFGKKTKGHHIEISNILVTNYMKDKAIPDNSEVTTSRFSINLLTQGKFIANNHLAIPFINKAYATSWESGDGISGLRNKIVKFEIICDNDILGIDAGQNLALPKTMKVYFNFGGNRDVKMSIPDWINNINNNEGFDGISPYSTPFRKTNQSYFFYFQNSFVTNEFVSFKMRIELDNGQTFEGETNKVKFI